MTTKTLEEAIGCWTVNPDYKSLPELAKAITQAAVWCRSATKRNKIDDLKRDLRILRARLDSMIEVTDSAITRCQQIIDTKELSLENVK